MKKNLLSGWVAILLMCCTLLPSTARSQRNIPRIIFETDIGNDVDDALAMDMIYKYLDAGKIKLLAVNSNKDSRYSTEYIHLLNCWYGYPAVPIGKVVHGAESENDARKYAEHVCLMKDDNGKELFPRPAFSYDALPDAVQLYRKILADQKDGAVTIVSVGFSTNLVRLLQSGPDEFSRLSGKELIARKVRLLSVMAGSFGEKKIAEYNVVKDVPAAQMLAQSWPTPIVYTPFEAGIAVKYPGRVIEHDFTWAPHHPVVEAYKYYLPMPYDRPTWDLIALLYAVENKPAYFTRSDWGDMSVDEKGFTHFSPSQGGRRAYLTLSPEQASNVLARFVQLTTLKPKAFK